MVERGLYLKDFEPIVQPKEYLETYQAGKFYVVEMVYILPNLEVDLCDADHLNTSLLTTESAEVQIDDVYLDDLEISQMRIIPRDNFRVTYLAKPKARTFLTTKNKVWQIPAVDDDAGVGIEQLNLNEIFQFEDTVMILKAKAISGTLTTARLEFYGFRFIVSEVDKTKIPAGIKPTRIPTEGYAGAATK